MPLYTFYPCRPDGGSDSFQTFELFDDSAAYARASIVLDQHASASHVVVWAGERQVLVKSRETAGAPQP